MDIKVQFDAKQLEAKTLRESKRLAFSAVQALNKTATDVQTAERVNLDRKFQVRKAGFFYRLIKVAFASVSKDKPVAEVYVDPTKQRVLLGLFEDGGEKTPAKGQNIAVPITGNEARPSFSQLVVDAFTFTKLRFKERAAQHGSKRIFEGAQDTFLIPGVGVFKRVSKTVTDLIYAFVRPMRMDKRLGFVDTAQKVFNDKFKKNFDDAYNSKKVD